ncbi:MAG TPA: hypothetical protein VEY51_04445 [Chondromyces sp.]|nr:hypothetical protein [Chondromyces sp.]
MNKKKETFNTLPDTEYEGRNKAYIDIDRMINDGLSAGSVHMRSEENTSNIEETVLFTDEEPPKFID